MQVAGRMHALRSTLMVCVKETATWPRLTLVSRLPSVCTAASGSMLSSRSPSILGRLCRFSAHMPSASAEPTANCKVGVKFLQAQQKAPSKLLQHHFRHLLSSAQRRGCMHAPAALCM